MKNLLVGNYQNIIASKVTGHGIVMDHTIQGKNDRKSMEGGGYRRISSQCITLSSNNYLEYKFCSCT